VSRVGAIQTAAKAPVALLSVAAALVGVVTLSGCGVSEAVDPVAKAAQVTQSLPGAQIIFTGEVVSPLASRHLHFSGRGVVNNHPLATRLTYQFLNLFAGSSAGRVSAELRILHHVLFLRFPLLADRLRGKQWLKIDERRTAQAAGLGSLPSADELDPDQYLTFLRAVSGGLTDVGFQMIHGVSTTGYQGEIELQRAARLAPADRRSATVSAVGNLEHVTGVHAIPFEVWIDQRSRVRRISLAEGESSTYPNAVKVYVTVDFLHFGREPRPPAPPSGEVFDATSQAVSAINEQLRP
jgi:hypothetical protein